MSLQNIINHSINASTASILERHSRMNNWESDVQLGCVPSCVKLDQSKIVCGVYTLRRNDKSLDLSCIPKNLDHCHPCERIIIINQKTQNCCSKNIDYKKVYLTYCCDSECESECECWCKCRCCRDKNMPVKIYLTNDHVPVKEDEFGNKVPEFYLIGKGQIKYLCIANGRITKIAN
jgi:hypothetical protein